MPSQNMKQNIFSLESLVDISHCSVVSHQNSTLGHFPVKIFPPGFGMQSLGMFQQYCTYSPQMFLILTLLHKNLNQTYLQT